MSAADFDLLESDHRRLVAVAERLVREANAKAVFLLDKSGQEMANAGDLRGLDPTALASLAAGIVAATDGLAKLIGEREFSVLFHEGERDHLHITLVDRSILLVLFDERSSLGLVRLRVKNSVPELRAVVEGVAARARTKQQAVIRPATQPLEITDEDIEALFG